MNEQNRATIMRRKLFFFPQFATKGKYEFWKKAGPTAARQRNWGLVKGKHIFQKDLAAADYKGFLMGAKPLILFLHVPNSDTPRHCKKMK